MRYALVVDNSVVEVVDGHPPYINNPDGTTTSASPDAKPNNKKLAAGGWFPIDEGKHLTAGENEVVIDDGFEIDHVRKKVSYKRHVKTAEPTVPEWHALEDRLNARIDAVEALFTGIRDRYDGALHAVEQAKQIVQHDAAEEARAILVQVQDIEARLAKQLRP